MLSQVRFFSREYSGQSGDRIQDAKQACPRDQRMTEMLEQVRLGKRTVWTADKLSGGEKQRWVLARVCLLEPEVYLLDEPSAALDDAAEDAIVPPWWPIISRHRENAAVHDHPFKTDCKKICDEIIEMKKRRRRRKGMNVKPHGRRLVLGIDQIMLAYGFVLLVLIIVMKRGSDGKRKFWFLPSA